MKTMHNAKYYVGAALLAASTLAGCAQPMYVSPDGRWYHAPVAAVAPAPRYVRDTVPVVRDMYGNVVAMGEREVRNFALYRTVVQGRTAVPKGYYTTDWHTTATAYDESLGSQRRVRWEDTPYQRVNW